MVTTPNACMRGLLWTFINAVSPYSSTVQFHATSAVVTHRPLYRVARCENGSAFTHGTLPWNSPKHYYILNVQKN